MAKKLPNLEWFQGRAQVLIDQDKDRDEMFVGIDDMVNLEWEVPEVLSKLQWVKPQVELFFRQIVQAATRILSDSKPRISLVSYDPNKEALVNAHEKVLKWQLHAASRRRSETIVHDMAESAVRYSMIIQQVTYLPEQIKGIESRKGNANRLKAIQRKSPFVVTTHSPRNVHPRFSDLGLEEIQIDRAMDPHAIVDLFSETVTNDLKAQIAASEGELSDAILREYVSYDYHCVWVEWGPVVNAETHARGSVFELLREPWKWTFLPFVVRVSGSNLDEGKDFQVRPLLGDAYHSKQFDLLNRIKTMRFSEQLRYAGSPKKWFQSDTRARPDLDVKSADLMVHITGDEKIGDLVPATPDPSLGMLYAELKADQSKSTLSDLLMGGEVPSGAAFASINMITHSAMAVLKPIRELVQNSMADLLEIFLLYAHYSQKSLIGYSMADEDRNTLYTIKPGEVDPANLFIDVELSADLPTDRQARMLTAQVGIQTGLLSRKDARQDIGVTDNQEVEDNLLSERWMDAFQAMDIENEKFLSSEMAKQQMRQQLLMELQKNPQMLQQLMQGAGGGQVPTEEAPPEGGGEPPPGAPGNQMPNNPTPETGIPGTELLQQGAEGLVPAEMNPNATREMQTNKTKGGQEIALE
jgi:hypothetical protein